MLRIAELFAAVGDGPDSPDICGVAVELTGVSGASVLLVEGDLPKASLCASGAGARLLAGLQFTCGEGPGIDAHRLGGPVAEPDLELPVLARWPAFAPPALAGGARAVFGFPLRIGAVRVGSLTLHQARPGPLDDEQHADALAVSDAAVRVVLGFHAGSPPGSLATVGDLGGDLHLVVHQAAGMVSVQLSTSVAEALLRLRGRAFADGRPVTEVARDVVERRLRFTDSPAPSPSDPRPTDEPTGRSDGPE